MSALTAFEYREPLAVAPDENLVCCDFEGIGAMESREVQDFLFGDPGRQVTILFRRGLDIAAGAQNKKPRAEQDRKGAQDWLYEQFGYSQFRLLRTATGQLK